MPWHLPNLIYVYLSQAMPNNILFASTSALPWSNSVTGFGFTAYTMYMIMVSEGEYKTVHDAIATGIMALGMMLPAMFSGWLQEQMGYQHYFLWVMAATIPGFIVTALVKIDPEYGKKEGFTAETLWSQRMTSTEKDCFLRPLPACRQAGAPPR